MLVVRCLRAMLLVMRLIDVVRQRMLGIHGHLPTISLFPQLVSWSLIVEIGGLHLRAFKV
jgi:hypothetical protein